MFHKKIKNLLPLLAFYIGVLCVLVAFGMVATLDVAFSYKIAGFFVLGITLSNLGAKILAILLKPSTRAKSWMALKK